MLEVLFVWVLFGLVSVFWGEKFCALVSRQFVPEYETNLWISFWVGLVLLSIFLGLFSFVFPFLPVVKLILWLTLLLPIVISFSWSKRFACSFFLQLNKNKDRWQNNNSQKGSHGHYWKSISKLIKIRSLASMNFRSRASWRSLKLKSYSPTPSQSSTQ